MADYPDLDAATVPELELPSGPVGPAPESLGFVIVWAPAELSLVGAWLPVSKELRVLGRGAALDTDRYPRMRAVRQAPGANTLLTPFSSPALSRAQLEVCQAEGSRV